MRFYVALLSFLLYLPTGVEAQRCEAPRVLLTVDRSSSMTGYLPSGITKWDAARVAVGDITRAFEDTVDFGLQLFPFPFGCIPGHINIDMDPGQASEIGWAMVLPPPDSGNYTPMAETLGVAALHGPLTDGARSSHVILITDGWQYCSPHDPSTRFDPVRAVSGLRALGVTVHVVGFGAEVDALVLNRAAVAAGTGLPGCARSGVLPTIPPSPPGAG